MVPVPDARGTLVNAGSATWNFGNVSGTGLTDTGTLGIGAFVDLGDTEPTGGESSTLLNAAAGTVIQTGDIYLNYDSTIDNQGVCDVRYDDSSIIRTSRSSISAYQRPARAIRRLRAGFRVHCG